ncbi:hypothetical protein MHO82_06680 [Vibrio sp. Of7-15]|uniref:hypothetical protein n=1 Tax=Vibrio sp. Of7-15 TaxID=2724879 RepID=UPI001EF2BF0C|nr:hypothetical protein [Vibrio sp. Of7-15]MCG7496541.1 hypothetical protein [Vibrio sp. Of7-15]
MKKLSFLLLMLFSTSSFAALEWMGPYTVKEAGSGAPAVYAVLTVHINEVDQLKTGCSLTDQTGMFSYWSRSLNDYFSLWQSALLSAQAQNKKVMLLADTANCSEYGSYLVGVKVLSE